MFTVKLPAQIDHHTYFTVILVALSSCFNANQLVGVTKNVCVSISKYRLFIRVELNVVESILHMQNAQLVPFVMCFHAVTTKTVSDSLHFYRGLSAGKSN